MLKLVWTPGKVQVPALPEYLQTQDRLTLDSSTGPLLQAFSRVELNQSAPATLPEPALKAALDAWLAIKARPRIVILVHGFSYDPSGKVGNGTDNPFNSVYGTPGSTLDYHNSWLPIVGECTDEGVSTGEDLAIAFAWTSQGSFSQFANVGWNNPYQYAVFDLAPLAARALATVILYLQQSADVPVHIFAHSLGTRATSLAFRQLERGPQDEKIGKLILLGGAEYCVDAFANLTGRAFQVLSVASRIDMVLSMGGDSFGHPVRYNGSDAARVIGRDGVKILPNWLDIQLDHPGVVPWLAGQDYPNISADHVDGDHSLAWMNHWAYYMNDGNRKLLSDLLADPDKNIDWFRSNHFPEGIDAFYYGDFGPFIPETPTSLDGRQYEPPLPKTNQGDAT